MRRFIAIVVIAAAGLTACGGGAASIAPLPLASSTPIASATPTIVSISGDDALKFAPAQVAAKPGDVVTFKVTNIGVLPHAFMVGPKEAVDAASAAGTAVIENIAAGETKEVSFTFGTTGAYTFACHIPGHFEGGMKGVITLTP